TLVNETKKAGVHQVEFKNTSELSSGVYFYTINAGTFTDTKKLILIK
ncbi:MAG TPA: T9SS type A sorting domain-containing protein, partial [Ignavibacteriaceae bacterium]